MGEGVDVALWGELLPVYFSKAFFFFFVESGVLLEAQPRVFGETTDFGVRW